MKRHTSVGNAKHIVMPTEGFDSLAELALDVHWSWNHATDGLWRTLDPVLWDLTQNPWVVLQTVSRDQLERVLADPAFRKNVDDRFRSKRQAAESPAWFQQEHPKAPLTCVAYFSMEFMLSEALPIYSGGLGNVAGDQLKAASDLGVPVAGVGMLYQQGYFRQVIDKNGDQQALFPYNDPGQLPITPLRHPSGEWLRLEIALPGYSVWLRAWQVQVGRVKLYLLDSNDAANLPIHRGITSELYGGGPELRLKQELLLGIGGWRLLRELGIEPEVCHLNEGHAAFAVLERARSFMEETGQPFEVALAATRAGRLEFGAQVFEWTRTKNDTGDKVVRLLNQGKGFLDYKALLDVHYMRESDDGVVDLFPLFIRRLLPYYTYPSGNRTLTFQAGWASLKSNVRTRWYGGDDTNFRNELLVFNEALEKTVGDLGVRATAMLKTFGDEFAVEFSFSRAEFQKGPKRIVGPRLLVKPAYRKLEIADYHDFFNEAKLSALAICMFFAALKDSPATGLRLLALDDVLIGLDMSNRARVLDLVHEHFSQWQIFILTYSKAWFESLKDKVKTLKWAADWIPIVLWEERAAADDSPRIVAEDSGDLLEMAARHLRRKDFTAAAVYARKALEFSCHKTCARASLKVVYVEGARDRQLQDFLDALRVRVATIANVPQRANALDLLIRLQRAKAFVLNPNAHFDVQEEDVLSVEVAAGLQAVKEFIEFAEAYSWKKNDGRGLKLSRRDELRFKIADVRAKLAEREFADAQNAMKDAHSIFWQLYGEKVGVSLQMGVDVTPWTVWKAAEQQRKLLDAVQARLLAARPYLSGSVETRDFDIAKCEDAILLLEELSAPLLLPAASN